ncbi:MAG: sensor histidine kinase, partial [Bacteroidia bacterium]
LDLTKIQFEKKEDKLESVNLNQMTQNAIEAMKPYAIQKDVTVEVHSPEDIYLDADPGDIEIVMNNLISNAVKYNEDKGKVDVYLSYKDEDTIEIKVVDTGIGMNEEEINKLFNEFYRAKNEKTKLITGSGLGLPIVKKVVDLYKGDIKVSSEPGKGSTFLVYFPAKSTLEYS